MISNEHFSLQKPVQWHKICVYYFDGKIECFNCVVFKNHYKHMRMKREKERERAGNQRKRRTVLINTVTSISNSTCTDSILLRIILNEKKSESAISLTHNSSWDYLFSQRLYIFSLTISSCCFYFNCISFVNIFRFAHFFFVHSPKVCGNSSTVAS